MFNILILRFSSQELPVFAYSIAKSSSLKKSIFSIPRINALMDLISFRKQSIYVALHAKMDFLYARCITLAEKIQSLWFVVVVHFTLKAFLFLAMPTLLRRINAYRYFQKNPKPPIPMPDQFKILEEKAMASFLLTSPPPGVKHPLKHYYTEIKGEVQFAYPKYFRPALDDLVKEYYASLPPPRRIRERVPVQKKPVFSSKKFAK